MKPGNIQFHDRSREIKIGEYSVRVPYPVPEYRIVNDVLVVLCDSAISNKSEQIDVDLPSDEQNVVALSEEGEKVWTISQPPDSSGDDNQHARFTAIDELTGRLLATHRNGRRYEVDPADGSLSTSYEPSQLPIGHTVVEINAGIDEFLELEDLVVVHADRSTEGGNVFGFGLDGTELWQSERTVGGSMYREEGQVWIEEAAGGRHWEKFPVDTETGEIGDGEVYQGYPN